MVGDSNKHNERISMVEEGSKNSQEIKKTENESDERNFLPGDLDKDEGRMNNGEIGGGITMQV